MSWINALFLLNELKDNRKQEIFKNRNGNYRIGSSQMVSRSIDSIYTQYLNDHYNNNPDDFEYTSNKQLYDKKRGLLWGNGTVENKNTGLRGTWDIKTRKVTWDKAGEWAQKLIDSGKYKGARMARRGDGTYELHTKNGVFFGNGRARDVNGKMRWFDVNTGAWIDPTDKPNPDKPNPDKPNPDKPNPDKPNPDKPNPDKPNPIGRTHTASYTMPTGADLYTKGALVGHNWSTNDWGFNGNHRGLLSDDIRKELGLAEGSNARAAQLKLKSLGFNISDDNVWGKQSQAAFDHWKELNKLIGAYTKSSQALTSLPIVKSLTNNDIKSPLTIKTPSLQPRPKLSMFNDDDIRNLGFHDYNGMVSAINNKDNANNNFVKAMTSLYGSDATLWNQELVEKSLGVKGRYRSFGGGDFGDMSRALGKYINKNNADIDKQELDNRTGSNGMVYSNKHVRDLFEAHPVQPKTNNFDTSSFGTNIFGTLKKQQGGTINMNEQQQMQQAFLQYLALQTGAKSQQELELIIQLMGEDGLKQAYAQFMQEMQQLQVQAAKFGAKLNYIKQLNGQCPEGMEMYYYKQGGRLCRKCMQAKQNGGELETPSNPIDAFKCGRKIKKNQQGRKFPLIETDKNGKNKKVYYKDEATRDSIAANRYNDQEVQVNRPGSYKKNAKGKVQWTPDRTKSPYKKG